MPNNAAINFDLSCLNAVGAGAATSKVDDVSSLTREIVHGSERAFEAFYDHYSPRVFKLLLVITKGDEQTARELHQCVMIKAARKMRVLESEEQLWQWLAQVARNAWKDLVRKRVREANALGALETTDANVDDEPARLNELAAAFDLLSPAERRLIEIFYLEEMPQKQISTVTGRTVKAIQCELARIRKRLKDLLLRQSK